MVSTVRRRFRQLFLRIRGNRIPPPSFILTILNAE